MLPSLIKQFAQIAFLTGKPYELPPAREALHLSVVLAFLTYVVAAVGAYGIGSAIAHALLDLGLSAGVLYVALSLAGRLPRFQQAYTAICGASAIINLASIPVIYTSFSGQAGKAIELANFVFLVWSISVLAHVIRFSFDTNIPVSILASIGYIILAVTVFTYAFPGTG